MSSLLLTEKQELTCPITLDIYRDPVLAGDGHVYERKAIITWIEQNGTSPLTREPLNVGDLCTDEYLRQLCQSYRSNNQTDSCQTSALSTSQITIDDQQEPSTTKTCNSKRLLIIFIVLSFIICPMIIATSIVLCISRSNSICSRFSMTTKSASSNSSYPSTQYILPNDCTLSNIVPLFTWKNVQSFNYQQYHAIYQAVSNRTVLTFAFRQDSSYWCLDDLSFIEMSSKKNLIMNGGFERNPPKEFFRCLSNGSQSTHSFPISIESHSGRQSYCAGSVHLPDYLSQKISTKIDDLYEISFWLANNGDAPNAAKVIISY